MNEPLQIISDEDDDVLVLSCPAPCLTCGGIEVWYDARRDPRYDLPRCVKCDPPSPRGAELRALAAAIREREQARDEEYERANAYSTRFILP